MNDQVIFETLRRKKQFTMWRVILLILAVSVVIPRPTSHAQSSKRTPSDVLDIGSRRELMVDDFLIDSGIPPDKIEGN